MIKVQNAAKPSLYGDNQASFSVQLDQYGATILEQALQGEMAPVAVIYSLDFIALRPAFNVQYETACDGQVVVGVDVLSSGSDSYGGYRHLRLNDWIK